MELMAPIGQQFSVCFLIGSLPGSVKRTDHCPEGEENPRNLLIFLQILLNLIEHLDGTLRSAISYMSKPCCFMSRRPKGRGSVRRMVSFNVTRL